MKVAFCSCNHVLVHPEQPGWLAVADAAPDVLLLLGDNVYVENTVFEVIGSQRPCVALSDLDFARRLHARYAAQYAVPQFRAALRASGLVMGTVDDHDFLGNDSFVSPVLQRKARFARALHRQFIAACNLRRLPVHYPDFEEVFNMEDTGFAQGLGLASSWEGQSTDGIGVKIIVLDNRSFRQAEYAQGLAGQAVCLGAAQISWLAQQLVGSQRVCLVASGSPLSRGERTGIPGSPLEAYRRETAILRTLFRGQLHQRIVHLGGDLHYNQHHRWSPERGCTELISSGMGSGVEPFSQQQRGNFGLVTVSKSQARLQLLGAEAERNLDTAILLGELA